MKVMTTQHRSVDLSLGDGCGTLRVTRTGGEDGGALVLALGFDTGPAFNRPAWHASPLTLPAAALPDLRRALEELDTPEAEAP